MAYKYLQNTKYDLFFNLLACFTICSDIYILKDVRERVLRLRKCIRPH